MSVYIMSKEDLEKLFWLATMSLKMYSIVKRIQIKWDIL